jgi:hypothetical protein
MAWDRYPEVKWLGLPAGFWIGMIGYVATGLMVGVILRETDAHAAVELAVGALVPLLPLLLMGHGLLRMIRQQDELYKRIQFEAIAYAVGIVVVLSFVLGFLESFDVVPHVNSMWAGQVLVFAWGIAAGILQRRYR